MAIKIENYSLTISDFDKEVLSSASLEIKSGEIVVLVGENGSGKSSFAMSLIGIPGYDRNGSVKIDNQETIDLDIDEIARLGLFVSFQSPPEIEGVSLFNFISSSYQAIHGNKLSTFKLRKQILESAKLVGLNESFLERSTNQGFSGGERRKSEVLQMLVLEPKIAILDEVDSGLDIKSTANIAKILRERADSQKTGILVISHSPEFIKKLSPERIIELKNKKFEEISIDQLSDINFESDTEINGDIQI